MSNNSLIENLLDEAISERIRQKKVEFLSELERILEDLFKRDLTPEELRKELADTISQAKTDARYSQYYINR